MLLPSRAARWRSCSDKTFSEEHVGDTVLVASLWQRLEDGGALRGNEGLPFCVLSFGEGCHLMFESNLVPNHRRLHVASKQHATCYLSRNATPMNSDDLGPREPSAFAAFWRRGEIEGVSKNKQTCVSHTYAGQRAWLDLCTARTMTVIVGSRSMQNAFVCCCSQQRKHKQQEVWIPLNKVSLKAADDAN